MYIESNLMAAQAELERHIKGEGLDHDTDHPLVKINQRLVESIRHTNEQIEAGRIVIVPRTQREDSPASGHHR